MQIYLKNLLIMILINVWDLVEIINFNMKVILTEDLVLIRDIILKVMNVNIHMIKIIILISLWLNTSLDRKYV